MPDSVFTAEQRDALQEIANLAMGRAARVVARALHRAVGAARAGRESDRRGRRAARDDGHSRQRDRRAPGFSFRHQGRGDRVVPHREHRAAHVGRRPHVRRWRVRRDGDTRRSRVRRRERADGRVRRVDPRLGRKPVFFPPGLLGANVSFDDVFQPTELAWSVALLLEVNFEPRTTRSAHFVMLMAEDSIRLMGDALDALLSAL